MNNLDIKGILGAASSIVDNLVTTKEEKAQIQLEFKKLDNQIQQGQLATNQQEAKHKSLFVAGWRPALGWICALGFAYQFLIYPFMGWLWAYLIAKHIIDPEATPPQALEVGIIMQLLFGMLGLGAYRTYEKQKGVQSDALKRRQAK